METLKAVHAAIENLAECIDAYCHDIRNCKKCVLGKDQLCSKSATILALCERATGGMENEQTI